MNRGELESFIAENFGVDADYPWVRYPTHAVFRHGDNRKWFALIMDVPRNRLGLQGAEPLAVLNVKCDPFLIGSLREEPGCFPAYHMSKDTWITVALDGSVADGTIAMLPHKVAGAVQTGSLCLAGSRTRCRVTGSCVR